MYSIYVFMLPLIRADHPFRGVLLGVCVCVCMVWKKVLAHYAGINSDSYDRTHELLFQFRRRERFFFVTEFISTPTPGPQRSLSSAHLEMVGARSKPLWSIYCQVLRNYTVRPPQKVRGSWRSLVPSFVLMVC
jgi:hypothetical protein